jgi:hypothetical protein
MLCLFEDGNLTGRRCVRRQSLFHGLYPFRENAHIVTSANVYEIYMGNTNQSANREMPFAIRRFVVSSSYDAASPEKAADFSVCFGCLRSSQMARPQ